MSASPHSLSQVPRVPDVLGELLHSLSQPLTTLRCSLELSLDHAAEQSPQRRREGVSAALLQTEKVIVLIELMREYLEAERPGPPAYSTMLAPVVRDVIEDLSSIAALRGIELRVAGTCTASIPLVEARLRGALQYLIAAQLEVQPAGGRVVLAMGEDRDGAVLRVQGGRPSRESDSQRASWRRPRNLAAAPPILARVRLAIASRVLESAGAAFFFGEADAMGFVLRIPAVIS